MDFGLQGKIAIVTGAAGAIGGAIAKDLAKEGVNLSLCYHNKNCDRLVEEIKEMGREVIAIQADITQPDEVNLAAKSTFEKFG
jgi:3-oxoacyl-[acyl-carrier protein] reductase